MKNIPRILFLFAIAIALSNPRGFAQDMPSFIKPSAMPTGSNPLSYVAKSTPKTQTWTYVGKTPYTPSFIKSPIIASQPTTPLAVAAQPIAPKITLKPTTPQAPIIKQQENLLGYTVAQTTTNDKGGITRFIGPIATADLNPNKEGGLTYSALGVPLADANPNTYGGTTYSLLGTPMLSTGSNNQNGRNYYLNGLFPIASRNPNSQGGLTTSLLGYPVDITNPNGQGGITKTNFGVPTLITDSTGKPQAGILSHWLNFMSS
jgi:hypothetical protein